MRRFTVRTECVDAVSERQQAAVDVRALDHSLAAVLRVGGALGAGEVDEEQLADTHLLLDAGHALALLDRDDQHGVRPRRRPVGRRRLLRPLLVAALQHRHHLHNAADPPGAQQ